MPPRHQEHHSLLGRDPTNAVAVDEEDNENDETNQQPKPPLHYHTVAAQPVSEFLTMDNAMDRLGFGPFQHRLVWAAGLCVMADGLEILLLSVLTVVLQSQWSLTYLQSSMLMSSVFCGALPGSLVLGQLADRYGRKPIFTLTATIIAVLGIATGFAPNYTWLLVGRWGVGFGVGGGTVPFDTLAEFLPRQQRGHHLLFIWFFWTMGTMLVVVLAYVTLGQGPVEHDDYDAVDNEPCSWWCWLQGWRIFLMACAIPCILSMILGILWVPESPRWLITARQDRKQALATLRNAAIINGKDPDVLFPLSTTTLVTTEEYQDICHSAAGHDGIMETGKVNDKEPFQQSATTPSQVQDPLWQLFHPTWLRTTLYLFGTWLGFDFLYYGGVLVTTLVFAHSTTSTSSTGALGDSSNATEGSYHFDYGALLVANAAEIVATLVIVLCVDKIGRIPIQIGSYLGGGILTLWLCLLASSQEQTHDDNGSNSNNMAMMVLLAFGTRMLNMAASCTTWVSTAEIYTTDVRSTGHATASAVARLGGMLVPYVVSTTTPLPRIGWIMMVVALATAFCASRLPETRGKDLGSVV